MSDKINKNNKSKKTLLLWAGSVIFCILFAAVYEYFSHGVYSNAMIFMFVYPLCLGFIPNWILLKNGLWKTNRLYNDGVLVLTLGSLLTGVLEIYGTESTLTTYYYPAGLALLALGMLVYIIKMCTYGKKKKETVLPSVTWQ